MTRKPLAPGKPSSTRGHSSLRGGLVLIAILLGGCGLDPQFKTLNKTSQAQTEAYTTTSFQLQSVRWETSGGGQIVFEISPLEGSPDFSILVTRYQMRNLYATISLSQSDGGPVFDFVYQLFTGKLRVASGNPCQGYCGSWTQATTRETSGMITDFSAPTVAGNPTPNPFDALYQHVVARLK